MQPKSFDFAKWMREKHPRVKYLEKGQPCEALTTSRGNLKMYFHPLTKVREEAQRKARCRNTAHWRFTYLKNNWHRGETKVFCLTHLVYFGVFSNPDEERATERQMVKTGYALPKETRTQRN